MNDRDIDRAREANLTVLMAQLRHEPVNGKYRCPKCGSDGYETLYIKDRKLKCFLCGERWDSIGFVMQERDLGFQEAIAWILNEPLPPRRPETPTRTGADHTPIYELFLDGCSPGGHGITWLISRGISPEAIERMRIRWCFDHRVVMGPVFDAFDMDDIKASGVTSFFKYYGSGNHPYLVIPYLDARGRAVFLKARVPVTKEQAETMGVPRFVHTADKVPFLYNQHGIDGADEVFITEGETDCLSGLSRGLTAVGLPGAGVCRPEWFKPLVGKRITLIPDPDPAGQRGLEKVKGYLLDAGIAQWNEVKNLPPGMDFNEWLTSKGK